MPFFHCHPMLCSWHHLFAFFILPFFSKTLSVLKQVFVKWWLIKNHVFIMANRLYSRVSICGINSSILLELLHVLKQIALDFYLFFTSFLCSNSIQKVLAYVSLICSFLADNLSLFFCCPKLLSCPSYLNSYISPHKFSLLLLSSVIIYSPSYLQP